MFQKVKVLTECRQTLKLMNLCVKSNLRVFGFEIPHFVLFTILSIPLSFSVVLHIWKAIEITSKSDGSEFESNLKELANILLMIVGTVQMQMIYFGLQLRNQNIISSLDRIQEVVDRSKIH